MVQSTFAGLPFETDYRLQVARELAVTCAKARATTSPGNARAMTGNL
jgi:hypothetical protein